MPQGSETYGDEREQRRPVSTDDLADVRPGADADEGRTVEARHEAVITPEARQTNQPNEQMQRMQQRAEPRRGDSDQESPSPLLSSGETDKFRVHWREIQAVFVDDPQEAVRGADQLVAEVIQAVATSFGHHKRDLEAQWQRGEDVSTEDLRLALRQYRSFFTRLLST